MPPRAASIPSAFLEKKKSIVDSLGVPDDLYQDLSPKGSVDEGIRELVGLINKREGLVTTSSCAGRVSVFVEGQKPRFEAEERNEQDTKKSPGGKGYGGQWLFVSHDPIISNEPLTELFGLAEEDHAIKPSTFDRHIKFQFEPIIIHVMAASLFHARTILAAALNAGMRESGLQTAKALTDTQVFPMVALRTHGLFLSSIIGVLDDREGEIPRSIVSEDYLLLLKKISDDRFANNKERTQRLQKALR